jgi:hypothetical protein
MMMSVEQSVECFAGESEVLGENLPRCRFVHHKSHMTRHGLEPGPPWWEADPMIKHLRYGTAYDFTYKEEISLDKLPAMKEQLKIRLRKIKNIRRFKENRSYKAELFQL